MTSPYPELNALHTAAMATLSEDEKYAIELSFLQDATIELINRQVMPGDGNLVNKAKMVLEMGVRHISAGRQSPDFLGFAAYCISRTLSGDEPSLDSAFRLKNKKHRPQKDPLEDAAIVAFNIHMIQYSMKVAALEKEKIPKARQDLLNFLKTMSGDSENEQISKLDGMLDHLGPELADRVKNTEREQRVAVEAAYVARWGAQSKNANFKIDEDIIKSRKRSITDELCSLGLYGKGV